MISVPFQSKSYNIMVIQVYALTSNTEEAEVEQFYEDLQDPLELTPKKDVLFIIGDWNEKVGSQETPGVTGKLGLGIRNEAGQRPIEFCQENALVIANTLFQQHKRRLYTWTSSDSQHQNQIDYILCSQRWRSSIQSAIEIYIKLNAPTLVHTSMCFHKYGGGLVTKLCPTLTIPWTVARQAPLSVGFPRQEYWKGLTLPSPGGLPDPGLNLCP